ncbi:MAG: ABC transporter ATP-binding protein [Fusobacteriaceae bacterium]|nr:ABC transporter ATP-binding protein [Fusobacteriaceae bacterium]
MVSNNTILKLVNIKKNYPGAVETKVLKGINFEISQGEFVAIVGQSGSGKTTLLNLIGLIDTPTEGEIYFKNEMVDFSNAKKLADTRNLNMGFIFQFHFLLTEFSVLENVLMPTWIKLKNNSFEFKKKAVDFLNFVGLSDEIHKKANQLSGGQQQRVAVARALVNESAIVFADEPTGNLDSENTKKIYSLLRDINREYNTTFVIVTHDLNIANLCDRIIEIADGQVISDRLNK